jgi:hypothetical protein
MPGIGKILVTLACVLVVMGLLGTFTDRVPLLGNK